MTMSPRLKTLFVILGGLLVAIVIAVWPRSDPQLDRMEATTAASEGNQPRLAALLARDPAIAGEVHQTSRIGLLHLAARSGSPETIRLVLAAGAPKAADIDGRTPLHHLFFNARGDAERGRVQESAEMLLAAGIELQAVDVLGSTVLHMASARSNPALALWLVQKKADPNVRDKQGYTPLDYALRVGATVAAKALAQAGFPRGAYQPPPEPAAR